jgi:hypothetical protein
MAPLSDEIWRLYRTALLQGLRLPTADPLMIPSNGVPLLLHTATDPVLPRVPRAVALAQVFRLGNVLPAWGLAYLPTANGDVVGLYREFVESLKRQNESAVRRANERLDLLDRQLASGDGELVMRVATAAGPATVPRFDPSPLGDPGFSGWLELAIQTYGKLPPEVDVSVSGAGRPGSTVERLHLTIHAVTTVTLSPADWFDPALLAAYGETSDFKPGTIFAERPIWGPRGTFNLLPSRLVAGFRPTVEVTFHDPLLGRQVMHLGGGPFEPLPAGEAGDRDHDRRRYADWAVGPLLLGVECLQPNYPPP